MIEALRASRGMIATTARLLGCTRQTIYDAILQHPEINNVVAGDRELMRDHAGLKLQEAVEAGEGWAVRFFLSTQGQARGYIERQRVDPEAKKLVVVVNRNRACEEVPLLLKGRKALEDHSVVVQNFDGSTVED
jgi:Bacterial regulatory protein, Fis family